MFTLRNTTPYLWYFLFFTSVIRLLVAPTFDLGVDEAHYVLYGLNLDLSYFDHPPLVGWVEYIFTSLFGVNEFAARVPAILIGFFTSLFIYNLLYKISSDRRVSLFGTFALNASFLFNALFMMLMPDTLLFLLIVPIIFATIALENERSLKNWLLLGVLLGVAGLSKYTAVLFLIPILLYFLIKKEYSIFKDLKLIPSIFIALLIISPVIIWNMQNSWISFAFQSDHVTGHNSFNLTFFLQSLAAQFGAYNPFLFIIAYFGLYKSLQSKNSYLFLSGLFSLILIVFFTYNSFYSRALPHWSSLFYLLMIPIGSYFLLLGKIKSRKYVHFSTVFGLLISALLYAELAFKFIPQKDYQSLHRDIYGYKEVLKEANKLLSLHSNSALAVTNWTLASRAIYYNQEYNSTLFLIDKRYDQFDIWNRKSPEGRDLLFINDKFFPFTLKNFSCSNVVMETSKDIILNGSIVNTFTFTWCSHFHNREESYENR